MTKETEILLGEAEKAKILYNSGMITREEAEKRIAPYAKAYNDKCKEIAKKYGRKAHKFSLPSFLR